MPSGRSSPRSPSTVSSPSPTTTPNRSPSATGSARRLTGQLAVRQARDLAQSALPDAPVRPEPDPAVAHPLRRRTALCLRRLADRLEPTPTLSAHTS
jgi:hypothetical protein